MSQDHFDIQFSAAPRDLRGRVEAQECIRKAVDLLKHHHGVTEDTAFTLLVQAAADSPRGVRETAEVIVQSDRDGDVPPELLVSPPVSWPSDAETDPAPWERPDELGGEPHLPPREVPPPEQRGGAVRGRRHL